MGSCRVFGHRFLPKRWRLVQIRNVRRFLSRRTCIGPPQTPQDRNGVRRCRLSGGRDFSPPSGPRQVFSAAALFISCTVAHSAAGTIFNAGASVRTADSGDFSVARVPRRRTCRVLPHTLTPEYVALLRMLPTCVGDHDRAPRGEATSSRSSSRAILK